MSWPNAGVGGLAGDVRWNVSPTYNMAIGNVTMTNAATSTHIIESDYFGPGRGGLPAYDSYKFDGNFTEDTATAGRYWSISDCQNNPSRYATHMRFSGLTADDLDITIGAPSGWVGAAGGGKRPSPSTVAISPASRSSARRSPSRPR